MCIIVFLSSLQQDILTSLCNVVKDCKNFKVRINAALALGSPPDRCQYGQTDVFVMVIESLIVGLQMSEQVTDLAEYRYRSNLNNQVGTHVGVGKYTGSCYYSLQIHRLLLL